MRTKHSSDERLLALLDGELPLVKALQTRAHLRSCWECRTRLTRLESAAQALGEARSSSRFLPRERIDAARRQFLAQAEGTRFEAPTLRLQLMALLGRRGIAFGCAGALGFAAAVTVWRQSAARLPDAVIAPPQVLKQESRPFVPPQTALGTPAATFRAIPPAADVSPLLAPEVTVEHETAVLWVLHQAGACRGQDIHVERRNGRLFVEGVVDTRWKRDELMRRLQELDFEAIVELRDLSQLLTQAVQPGSSAAQRVTQVAAPGEPAIRAWLQSQDGATETRITEIANASVRWADRGWAESWALRELRDRFGPVWKDLSESSRASVLSMLRDHWRELRSAAERQREVLRGVLPSAPASDSDAIEAAESWNDAVQALFAPAEPVSVPAAALLTQLSSSLSRIELMDDDDAALAAFVRGAPDIVQASK